jgi:flagellar L-ring protein precursor FlgH
MSFAERNLMVAVIVAIGLMLTGCAALQDDGGREFDATWPDSADMPKPTNGSIYAQGTEVSLWENVTARNVGDTLTIRLEESTNAEKSVSTNTAKTTEATMTGPTIFGRPVTVNGVPVLEARSTTTRASTAMAPASRAMPSMAR